MGSGGPRGLQILRSGVNRVRGGFDSHAFPPLWRVLVAALLGAVGLTVEARAQLVEGPPDSTTGAVVDTARIVEFPRSRVIPRTVAAAPTGFDQPRWVMLRSLVVPGWGQLHNRSWTKALGVAAGEGWLGYRVFDDQRQLDRLAHAADSETDAERHNDLVDAYNQRLNDSVRNQWLLGGVLVYALLDAYIDAHFRNFDVEFESDPALPAESGSPGQRMYVRWHW